MKNLILISTLLMTVSAFSFETPRFCSNVESSSVRQGLHQCAFDKRMSELLGEEGIDNKCNEIHRKILDCGNVNFSREDIENIINEGINNAEDRFALREISFESLYNESRTTDNSPQELQQEQPEIECDDNGLCLELTPVVEVQEQQPQINCYHANDCYPDITFETTQQDPYRGCDESNGQQCQQPQQSGRFR